MGYTKVAVELGRKRQRAVAVLAAGGLLLSVGAAEAGTVYDAATDFSISSGNPNGVWTYGYGVPGSSFTAFSQTGTACFESGFSCWSSNGYVPLIGVNTNAFTETGGTHAFPAGAMVLHPAYGVTSGGPNWAILRWTAPSSGSITFNGAITVYDRGQDANTQGATTDTTLGASLIENALLHGPYGTAIPVSGSASVTAGEVLDLAVGPSPNGGYSFLPTGVALTIDFTPLASVPEPATWATMLIGLLGLGAAMRWRRSRQRAAAA